MHPPPVLVRILRAFPHTGSYSGEPLGPNDEAELLAQARRHGLSVVVHRWVEEGVIGVSAPAAEAFREEARTSVARTLGLRRLLRRCLEALGEAGVPAVLLKGAGLADRCYPDPMMRPFRDVDLLVSEADFANATRALRGLGLSPRRGHARAPGDPLGHHLELQDEAGHTVELHHRLISVFGLHLPADPAMRASVPATLDGASVRYLRPEDELGYLALHAVNHLMQRLAWLLDLKLLLRAHPGLVTLELPSPLRALAWYALDAAARVVDAPVPAPLLDDAPSRMKSQLARRLFTADRLARAELWGHPVRWLAAKAALSPSLWPLAAELGHRLLWR